MNRSNLTDELNNNMENSPLHQQSESGRNSSKTETIMTLEQEILKKETQEKIHQKDIDGE